MAVYIKSNRKDSNGIPVIIHDNILVKDDEGKAAFNTQQPDFVPRYCPDLPNMDEIDVTEPGVHALLANLNPHSANGPDGISNQVLKRCAAHNCTFFSDI